MAKTDLTRSIEKYLQRDYDPTYLGGVRLNKKRPHFTALEVPVECGTIQQGLVDAIRVDECFMNEQDVTHCVLKGIQKELFAEMTRYTCCPHPDAEGEQVAHCSNRVCGYCRTSRLGTASILVTAFEIKISVSDFHSRHGHNFCGNCNYYVLPADIYDSVKDSIPDDIGVLVFYDGTQKRSSNSTAFPYYGLRKKRECVYKSLNPEEQLWLLLSTMKREQKQRIADEASHFTDENSDEISEMW